MYSDKLYEKGELRNIYVHCSCREKAIAVIDCKEQRLELMPTRSKKIVELQRSITKEYEDYKAGRIKKLSFA